MIRSSRISREEIESAGGTPVPEAASGRDDCPGKKYFVQTRLQDGEMYTGLMTSGEIIAEESMSDCSCVEMAVWESSGFGSLTKLTLHGCWHDHNRPLYIKATRPNGSTAFDGWGEDH